jgi:DNA-binding response OmpR family regulator
MQNDKPKILIVEDDISSQQYYTTVLGDVYTLVIVPTAEKAREALAKENYHLIIMIYLFRERRIASGLCNISEKHLEVMFPCLLLQPMCSLRTAQMQSWQAPMNFSQNQS